MHALRDQLLRRLLEKADKLAQLVLPGGEQRNNEWKARGPDGARWGVVIKGPRRGWWQNFGTGCGGKELLTFIRDGMCGGDFQRAWHFAWDFVGGKPQELPDRPTPADAPAPEPVTNSGQGHWVRAAPFSWDGPAGQYLQGRGIDPECFPRGINVLRSGVLWNDEEKQRMPAMLAAITDPVSRRFIALHRTFLEYRRGGWRKASVPTPKKVQGRMKGGLIVLTRGASDRNWRDMVAPESLVLAEGIENALSLAQTWPAYRSAAYIAAGNLTDLILPLEITTIVLGRDRDGMNQPIRDTRATMAAHWEREGRKVDPWEPPRGFKDANDYLMGRAA